MKNRFTINIAGRDLVCQLDPEPGAISAIYEEQDGIAWLHPSFHRHLAALESLVTADARDTDDTPPKPLAGDVKAQTLDVARRYADLVNTLERLVGQRSSDGECSYHCPLCEEEHWYSTAPGLLQHVLGKHQKRLNAA